MPAAFTFLKSFIRHPGTIGAIAPSSRGLARRMVDWIDWQAVDGVLEFGPGTGAFTGHILERIQADTTFAAIEIDEALIPGLKQRFPDLDLRNQSATEARAICDDLELDQVEAIISGLPWAAFPDDLQIALLDAIRDVLKPGGSFATFAYLQGLLLPAGKAFRKRLDEYFSDVTCSRTVWANIPPAFVYRCTL